MGKTAKEARLETVETSAGDLSESLDGLIADLPEQPDLELDFDPADFAFTDSEMEPTRIMPPTMPKASLLDTVCYERAVECARHLDLRPRHRTIALVSGNFIFGDLIEALIIERGIDVQELTISTLSISEDNVDSLRNILEERNVEKLNLCISAYFYSHNRATLVPYIYQELDMGERLQVAFSNTHCKLCLIASRKGTRYVLHGSANLRSSSCMEQIELEENKALYDFYYETIGNIIRKYPTIDHKRPNIARGSVSWQAVLDGTHASTGSARRLRPGDAEQRDGAAVSASQKRRWTASQRPCRSDAGGELNAQRVSKGRTPAGEHRGPEKVAREDPVPKGQRPRPGGRSKGKRDPAPAARL